VTIPKLPILLLGLVAALLLAPSAMATFPGKNGHIVFQKTKGGLMKDLFVMNANGSHQRDITNTPKINETHPWFAPDGRRIVFLWDDYKRAGLGVINADGTGMRRIVSGSYDEGFQSPSWTADGKSIVYTRYQGTDPPTHVYIVSANGGTQRQLTSGDVQDFNPIVSPVTGKIAFFSYPPGNEGDEMLMNTDGSGATPLHHFYADDFSPDGSRFIFERDHDIYASALDGSGFVKLAGLPKRDTSPVWSPDGKKFIFTNEAAHDIFIANADGSGVKNLTRAPGFEHQASWGKAAKLPKKKGRH
jgi:TolB protein